MRCPALNELPPPAVTKVGWPWTETSARMPEMMTDGNPSPRISIVTPSYNQGQFIEECIRSVLLQGYPNLEYIMIDGGSTDGSVEIIRKYEPWLAFWTSEPDAGQSEAINKGLARATGEWVAWINSDDRYLPNAFARVADVSARSPTIGLIFGDMELVLDRGAHIIGYSTVPERMLEELAFPFQPTCFFRRSVLKKVGVLDPSLHYVMDADLLLRVMTNTDWLYIPAALASFRIQGNTKTNTAEAEFAREMLVLLDRVLAERAAYPKLQHLTERHLRSRFYRRASKHLYMGNRFCESFMLIVGAVQMNPRAFFSIIQDEGVGWFARRLMPPIMFRWISAQYRAKGRR